MKKILFVLLAAVIVFSCNKDDEVNTPPEQDVVFNISNINFGGGLKSANIAADPTPIPECPTDGSGNLLEPVSANIWINDGTGAVLYTPAVYRLDGNLYTEAIKLEAAEGGPTTYTVEDFVLKAEDGTVIMATPAEGSDYAVYVETTVDFTFDVNAFEKNEVAVDVLCFMPKDYDYFGFTWFKITEIAVRELCFFGDICLNGDPFAPADFEGSLYGTDLPVDVPAIMKIVVKRNGTEVPNSPFKTVDAQAGEPLCVQYPDRLNIPGEVFTFELQLWLPDGNGFSYQTYVTYTATDDGALDIDDGGDGVVDVVVGSCGYEGADDTFDFLYAPAFELTDPSEQNAINKDAGTGPYFNYEIDGLEITFELVNPVGNDVYFDYQVDGEAGYSWDLSEDEITQGPLEGELFGDIYNSVKVDANTTKTIVVSGTSEIRIGIHHGPEQHNYLDWATFTAN